MDEGKRYSGLEIVELLEKAERLGFSLEAGSELEKLTLNQLDALVRDKERGT